MLKKRFCIQNGNSVKGNKSIYWLELLKETDFLSGEQFQSVHKDAVEIIKLITSIIKTAKLKIKN